MSYRLENMVNTIKFIENSSFKHNCEHIVIAIHDDVDASVLEGVKDSK